MCGIVGGVTNTDITPLLLDGLNRLEYRGYDSSGLVLLKKNNKLILKRAVGKVSNLANKLKLNKIKGKIGLAHTRWATHGEPSNENTHPHISNNSICVVHNGIIENYSELKKLQIEQGYEFTSETDTEVIAHKIDFASQSSNSLLEATQKALKTLNGSYGLGIISSNYPDQIIAARKSSPLVIGIGDNGNYIASDQTALLSVTRKFIFLEDMNIKFVQSLGDMVQSSPENGGHNNLEWGRAQQMYDLLLDADIPAVPLAGNHEWGSDNDYTWLNKYFPLSKFQSRDWWGGNINGIENTYQQLILGQEKYLFISIGWKITDDVKEWAKNIIQSHSDHKVIISHHYKAKVPFAELVDPFENVIMTLHGHVNKETYETSNNGRSHSFEQGFQDEGFDAGEKGDCQIRYFLFKPLEDKVEWWTYSVVMNEGKGGYWTKQPSSQGSFHLVQIGPGESEEEK